MIKQSNFLIFLILAISGTLNLDAQETRHWFESGPWRRPVPNPQATELPLISVQGNSFVNPGGDTLLIRGMAISDPDKLEVQGHWGRDHFDKVKATGAGIVRIPVHPAAWRERTPEKYLELLDSAVSWCTERKMYVIIDWHSIGNLGMELFQNPMYNTTRQETYEFWRTIANHFKGHHTVAFYEIFNEPTIYRGQLGSMTWPEWKQINENIIKLIRSYDPETVPLVAGFDWAYDLTPLHTDPLDLEGIGYVSHPYEHKRRPPWEPKWEEAFGFAKAQYPVMVTEFGFGVRNGQTIGEDHYGNHIIDYLESRGISWVCWVYDAEWGPRMLKSWDTYELTESGEFFKEAMHGKLAVQND
jgi:endoglucanase